MKDHGLRSLDEVIAHYLAEKKPKADNERRWFRIQRKLHHAVRLTGLATGPQGRRFRHQYRIPRRALERASRALLRDFRKIGHCKTFETLLDQVHGSISAVPGVGELMVYDTALRIGAR